MRTASKPLTRLFRALSNEKRLMIVKAIAIGGEETNNTLSDKLNLPYPTVARHLKILESSGVLTSREYGATQFYSLKLHDHKVVQAILDNTVSILK